MKTFWFGRDCLGNTSHAMTVEGTCYQNIYAEAPRAFYNEQTGEHGRVEREADGELHFHAEAGAS